MTVNSPTSAGICLGSEMSGGIADVTVEGFTGVNVSTGLRVKTASERGGYVKNVSMRDVTLHGVNSWAIQINAFYGGTNPLCTGKAVKTPPVVDNITVVDWVGTGVKSAADLEGLLIHHSTNLRFQNVSLSLTSTPTAKNGFKCSGIEGSAQDVTPTPCKELKQN